MTGRRAALQYVRQQLSLENLREPGMDRLLAVLESNLCLRRTIQCGETWNRFGFPNVCSTETMRKRAWYSSDTSRYSCFGLKVNQWKIGKQTRNQMKLIEFLLRTCQRPFNPAIMFYINHRGSTRAGNAKPNASSGRGFALLSQVGAKVYICRGISAGIAADMCHRVR